MRPGLAAGWILLFVAMMRELGSSILLYSYNAEVISVALYDMWEGGEFGSLSAYAFSTSFITLGILFLFQKLFRVDITKRL
jgi:iron(III) transport system permease protein